jgi:type VI secretion system secreted protein VgrG
MTGPTTQDGRLIALETPLGKDFFLLTSISATEALSEPFRFDLEALSDDMAVSAKDMVGSEVTIRIGMPDAQTRTIHGLVGGFSAGAVQIEGFRTYRIRVVPWLWLLSHSADCRIFQNLSVPEILEKVFQDHGFQDYELRVQPGDYPPREFCVQYRETALDFVSRLMEQEGLFYFFEYEEKRHLLVVADANVAFQPLPEERVICSAAGGQARGISGWEHVYELRTGRRAFRDFNFEKPSTDLLSDEATVVEMDVARRLERFDYPGSYAELDRGKQLARVQMQAEEAGHHRVLGSSEYVQFAPGGRFTVAEHPIRAEIDGSYVLRRVRHEAREGSYFAGETPSSYANEFVALPADIAFRAPVRTPKPLVQGPQTAIVVGPPGDEILTDRYGRVKLQFHWDRLGQRDDKSSCWVRVSQSWAGAGYGFIQIPRIGQEVIVDFLEGDPDRPIVTGRVYNAEQMPPHGLPDAAVKSGLKSNSTKGGGGSNELTFDDTKGKEKVFFHAQYDHEAVVEHDETQHVKNNRTRTVDVNETLTVHADRARTVDGKEAVTIGGNRDRSVGGNESYVVSGNRSYEVGGNETLSVSGKQDAAVTGNQTMSVSGKQEVIVSGAAILQTDANREVSAASTYKLEAMKVEITGQAEISLTVGGSFIKIDPSGVTVFGPMIKLN